MIELYTMLLCCFVGPLALIWAYYIIRAFFFYKPSTANAPTGDNEVKE